MSWTNRKVSHHFRTGSGTTPPTDQTQYFGGDVPWINSGDLRDGPVTEVAKTVTRDALTTFSALREFPSGSIVIAMYGATVGRLGILGFPAVVNQACCVLAPIGELDTQFMFFWLSSQREHLLRAAQGGGQTNISQETIRQMRVESPPLARQRAIAEFLDCKTAVIDTLIAKKERLIELLEERRTVFINQMVTKGLDAMASQGHPDPLDWRDT